MRKPLAGRRGRSQWCDASARSAVRDTCAELFDSVDCIIGTMGRKKNERGLPPRRARSGQRGKRSREYDRSTKSDRQIASTTKPRLRQCVTARQRPHFPLYQSQQQERCRRKAALNMKKAVYSSRTDGKTYQSFLHMTLGLSVYYIEQLVFYCCLRILLSNSISK